MKRELGLISMFAVLALWGCGNVDGSKPKLPAESGGPKPDPIAPEHSGKHTHIAAHGGIVNSVDNFHVELVFDMAASKLTAYILGEDGTTSLPIGAQSISAEAKPEGGDQFVSLSLTPAPQAEEKAGAVSRFEAPAGELVKAKAFELLLRIPTNDKTYRTSFQVEPGKQASTKSYMCPMKHDANKVYAQPGKCEVCGMALVESKDGRLEHTDHTAKHGGVFFMASDNWHHLEGILASQSEFRLYLYDNFTKPISATPYEATAEVVRTDAKGKEIGKSKIIAMKPSKDGAYLIAAISEDYPVPVYFTVRVKLREGERPALFNFSFEKVTDQAGSKRDEHASN